MDSPMHEGRQLPEFELRENDLPEVFKWEVNSQHYLVLKVEMTAKRNRQDLDAPRSDKEKVEGSFRILSIKALGDTPVDAKTLEQKHFESIVTKAKSGV